VFSKPRPPIVLALEAEFSVDIFNTRWHVITNQID
jgi:hypothetical protein